MFADHTAKILLFQTRCIKAGQQHIVDNQNVNLALLKIVLITAAGFFVIHIMKNENMAEIGVVAQFILHHTRLIRGVADDHSTD